MQNTLKHSFLIVKDLNKGTRVEAGSIWAGVPAKKVKNISPELIEGEVMRIANNYKKYASWFKETD